ncbi:putative Calcitonin receptor [Hypsibius exemplaris]|uniref:Calcitonin receptor n=1 Tax=Hypsibius exemplaris TaxID=2072580 RepID=A0A9X6RM68_HYPEX|nr:putative Calcitonin receptor [Hypsibius exemplaris]
MESMCRNELGYHPVNVYLNITCALCYVYTFHSADQATYPLTYFHDGFLTHHSDNASDLYLPTAFDRSSPVYAAGFPATVSGGEGGAESDHDAQLWRDCCQAAADCCVDQLKAAKHDSNQTSRSNGSHHNHPSSAEGLSVRECPMTWDGWQCWAQTGKGETAQGSCPRYINPVSSQVCSPGFPEKKCTEDGSWFRLESLDEFDGNFSKEWTNYTSCFNLTPLEHRYQMQLISYCISISFLVPALLIFWRCKKLRVQRNMIHLNFFLSLFMYAVALIVLQTTITHKLFESSNAPEAYAAADSSAGIEQCRLSYVLTIYLRLCNYGWMFCEGLFLLRHLKHVFMQEQRFYLYTGGGWGLPAIPVAIYIYMRSEDSGCWMEPKDHLEWILKGPALLTLGLNFIFLWYIVCLLLKKLQTRYVSEVEKFRKSCRAVLVLLPLFGLHFVITAYRPAESCGLQWYFLLNVALDGLQGFFVSMTFCYTNGEVIALAKRTLHVFHTRRNILTRSVSGRSAGSNSSGATGMSTDGFQLASTVPGRSVSTSTRPARLFRMETTNSVSRTRKKGQAQLCRFESLMERKEYPESRNLLGLALKKFGREEGTLTSPC